MFNRYTHKPRGQRRQRNGINKTEQEYSDILEARKRAGEIAWFSYEGIKFRLADRTWYNVDFLILNSDGSVECHEVKAGKKDGTALIEEDANVKVKVAAEMFPFPFFLCIKLPRGAGWKIDPV